MFVTHRSSLPSLHPVIQPARSKRTMASFRLATFAPLCLTAVVASALLLSSSPCALAASLKDPTAAADSTEQQATSAAMSAEVPAPAPAPMGLPCDGDPLCGNPVTVNWYQAHGWLMWMGFGVFLPLGIITSRHLQTVTKYWFYIHIGLMSTGTACIVAGGGIAFALFGAIPGTPSGDPAYLHITMGTAVFVLACLNLLMGMVRPHKGTKLRILWYFFHFAVGTVAVLLAWYTIYTGMDIYEANWVIGTGSGLPDLGVLRNLFTANIAIMAFVYLLLGRWDYMVGQGDPEPKLDGLLRFSSGKNPNIQVRNVASKENLAAMVKEEKVEIKTDS